MPLDDNDKLMAGELPFDPFEDAVPVGPEGEHWALPLPLTRSEDLPPFPTHTLPPWLRNFVEGAATQWAVPPELPAMLAQAVIAIAGPRISVRIRDGWKEPHLSTFVAVAMRSGERKTPVFKAMTEPLVFWIREQRSVTEVLIVEREAIADLAKKRHEETLRQAKKGNPEVGQEQVVESAAELARARASIPALPRIRTSDCTPEQLAVLMAAQGGRLAVLSDEGGVLDILGGQYSSSGGANLDPFLQGYSGSPIRMDRVTRANLDVERPELAVGLTIQPSVLQALGSDSRFRGRGLLARFLWALPTSRVGYRDVAPPAMPLEVRNEYRERITALLRQRRSDHRGLFFSHAAQLELEALAAEIEPRQRAESGDLAWINDWVSKFAGNVARIAGVLHVASHGLGKERIEVAEVRAAVEIGRFMLAHASAAYAAMHRSPSLSAAELLLPYVHELRQGGAESVSHTELHKRARGRGGFDKADAVLSALETLESHGFVRRLAPPRHKGPGRPASPRFVVNPLWEP